jgi:integrase
MANIKAPQHISWRNDRPRFQPGRALRRLGYQGQDLRHADGRWFTLEETRGFAQARAQEIAALRATGKKLKRPPVERGRSVHDLVQAYLRSPDFARLRASTQADYRFKSYAVSWQPVEIAGRAQSGGDRPEREREQFSLAPASAIGKPEVKAFFEYLARARGLVMARQTIMLLSAAYKWGTLDAHWRLPGNPCNKIDLPKPKPRVVTWELDEVQAFVAAADLPAIDAPELADAVLIALFSGQRQGDVLAFTGAGNSDGVIRLVQAKTGTRVEIPLIAPLAARLAKMAERRVARGIGAPELVVDSRTGRGFNSFTFRHRFAELRAKVASGDDALGIAACPTIADKNFQDLRDTMLTWLHRAGADMKTIAGVSGHALSSIAQVLPHYVALGSADAANAMRLLSAWMDEKGMAV